MRADETRDDDVPPRGAPRSDSSSASSETSAVSSSAAEEEDEAAAAAAVISPSPPSTSSSRSSSSCSAASAAAGPGAEDDLPYPGFVPIALYYFHQDRPPRSWCLRMVTNPYPWLPMSDMSHFCCCPFVFCNAFFSSVSLLSLSSPYLAGVERAACPPFPCPSRQHPPLPPALQCSAINEFLPRVGGPGGD
ncbi:hypothetical protein MRX96_040472 [Rhipicephalus microplus]